MRSVVHVAEAGKRPSWQTTKEKYKRARAHTYTQELTWWGTLGHEIGPGFGIKVKNMSITQVPRAIVSSIADHFVSKNHTRSSVASSRTTTSRRDHSPATFRKVVLVQVGFVTSIVSSEYVHTPSVNDRGV